MSARGSANRIHGCAVWASSGEDSDFLKSMRGWIAADRSRSRRWVEVCIFGFFFQAEDGIRDLTVTGVQTCALPILMKETHAAHIPGKLSATQAGAMAVDVVTAYAGLETTLHLKSGESVLIFGASGGIGHLAVQLAKRMGARVLAVAPGPDGVALAKR